MIYTINYHASLFDEFREAVERLENGYEDGDAMEPAIDTSAIGAEIFRRAARIVPKIAFVEIKDARQGR